MSAQKIAAIVRMYGNILDHLSTEAGAEQASSYWLRKMLQSDNIFALPFKAEGRWYTYNPLKQVLETTSQLVSDIRDEADRQSAEQQCRAVLRDSITRCEERESQIREDWLATFLAGASPLQRADFRDFINALSRFVEESDLHSSKVVVFGAFAEEKRTARSYIQVAVISEALSGKTSEERAKLVGPLTECASFVKVIGLTREEYETSIGLSKSELVWESRRAE
jgi:hypothetical protein